MENERELAAALRALAESDCEKEAPPEIEARLRSRFRARWKRARWTKSILWAAAAAVILAAIVTIPHPQRTPPAVGVQEAVTQFFPLIEPVPPLGNGMVVRVSLPASAMRTVGLPVREDRLSEPVQADVLVSEDGLAEAIRFVQVSEHP